MIIKGISIVLIKRKRYYTMNGNIPTDNYLSLKKQLSLKEILENIYNQIEILKNIPQLNNNINFELEFRLLNKYANINVENFVSSNSCLYSEYLLKENQSTKYRIICDSHYYSENNEGLINANKNNNKKENTNNNKVENIKSNAEKENKLFDFIKANAKKEITNTLDEKIEYTKKLTLITGYYYIFKIVLSIETPLDIKNIINIKSNNFSNNKCLEWKIINSNNPVLKKRRSFLMDKDVRFDVTYYDEKSQFEIDFSNNIYIDRLDMLNIINNMIKLIHSPSYYTDYLFMLLPNFEFQKPITPSFEILFNNSKKLIKNSFYIATKTDGLRKLLIIINNLMFSITENFTVEFVDEIESDFHIVMDCEYINNKFIPFDIIYNDVDLRSKAYCERIDILNSLDFNKFGNKVMKKHIKYGKSYQDIQKYIASEMNNDLPNDGIIITDSKSTYFENSNVYKIKTINSVDIEFNGRYFLAKQKKIDKKYLNISLSEYKKICKLYNIHKKKSNKDNVYYHYRKHVEYIYNTPTNIRCVYYCKEKLKKKPFIIEFNLDTQKMVKVREDKPSSNSINTFISVLLATHQKINIDIFNPESNVLMRKYHNIIKNNVLKNYRGNLLDIGSGNGGDIHKWKHFHKILCVESKSDKIKKIKSRLSKAEIKNRVKIINNNIQKVTLQENFDVATCFFALNDFCYSDITNMLINIGKNINGAFIIIFFDSNIMDEDIESPSITYKRCFIKRDNKIVNIIDKSSPLYLISSLRYSHRECDNLMYVNITGSNLSNHYEYGLNSSRVIEIFNEHKFKLKKQYSVDDFHFLNQSQIKYSSYIKIIEFTNLEDS
ncbi:hypothetical protein BCR36DRAFT_416709 [Piromyces finnis]|uniref:Methyltransferase domain-containing protein n=1 Tax=Piromyces finnis TaxID=1754191 RepID=A0A1Y1UU43_9FUNG|nr:hypothetical protein BCR36DRAFT_416709 [Piromyces finnis]|eukprot:ORX41534.1 hypothetical protein BCR36DRAFT_416709 [Piromyces finnis]